MRSILSPLLAVLLAAPAGPAVAAAGELLPGGVPPGVVVREVRIAGNARVESATIRAALETAPGETLDPDVLREDLRRVFRLGFFDDVSIDLEGDPARGVVVVTVAEKPLVRDLEVVGNEALEDEKLLEVVAVKRGELLDVPKLKRSAERIREKYAGEGYLLAEVSFARAAVAPGLVDVTFTVVEAAKAAVRKITFVGNTSLPAAELKAAVETTEADTLSFVKGTGRFSAEALARDVDRLKAAYHDVGYLDATVEPCVTFSRDRREVHVTFHVIEGRRYRVGRVGLRYDAGVVEAGAGRSVTHGAHAEAASLVPGEWFSRKKLAADIAELTRIYRDAGYAYVNVVLVPEIVPITTDDPVCK